MKNIISIVTPSYNQGLFIEDTIRSILSQEGDFYLDYVIIDGNSSDQSVKIINKYEKLLANNCYIREIEGHNFYISSVPNFDFNKCLGISYRYISEKDSGHGDALNKGFLMTFGNIMAWLNSDDKYHAGAFYKVFDIFSTFNDVEFIIGKNTWWDEAGNLSGEAVVLKNFYDFIFGDYAWIQQESTFWRRSLWEKAGAVINTDVEYMVDGELWCRFLKYAKLHHIDQKLGGYRVHGTNRAKLNYRAIVGEMDQLISQMKKHLPSTNYGIIHGDCGNWIRNEVPYKVQIQKQAEENTKGHLEYRIGIWVLFIPRFIVKIMKNLKFTSFSIDYFKKLKKLSPKIIFAFFSPIIFVKKYLNLIINGKFRQPARKIYYAVRFKKIK